MARYDDPDDIRDRIDDEHAFTVTCSDCGTGYDNRERGCPSCGSGNCSYSSDDASRWNARPRVR